MFENTTTENLIFYLENEIPYWLERANKVKDAIKRLSVKRATEANRERVLDVLHARGINHVSLPSGL